MMAKTLSSNTFTFVKKYKNVHIPFYISSEGDHHEYNPKGDHHGSI